ncbi:MAG: TonB-dependent receptor [Acidobacteriota bacterium]
MLAPLAFANVTTSSITGRVSVSGKPASGVTVTAESPALQHPRTTLTGPRGTYWLGALPPGEYDVTFSLAGHTTVTRRAIAELGLVARTDATLEPNEDEESVTSTATTPNVTETTAITTHFDDRELDRLPLGRERTATAIAPGPVSAGEVDGVPASLGGVAGGGDLIEQITVVRGAAAADVEASNGQLVVLRTRRGGEDLSISLRDTLSNSAWIDNGRIFGEPRIGLQHRFELTAGGSILPEKLWFFAGGWNGHDATAVFEETRGFNAKLQGQLGDAHHLEGSYTESRAEGTTPFRSDTNSAWLQYTGVAGPHLTWETQVAHLSVDTSVFNGPFLGGRASDVLSSRVSYVIPAASGDHVLTAGLNLANGEPFDARALYVSDRWSASRWVVNAGLRYDDAGGDDRVTPRIAVTYDLGSRGTSALTASYGEYVLTGVPATFQPITDPRVLTLGYAMAIGSMGMLRIDALHRDLGVTSTNSLQLDTHYRIFDRFEAGATYTYSHSDDELVTPFDSEHSANAWFGAELPIGEHELGVTLLQRYFQVSNPPYSEYVLPTDLAVRYTVPFPRFRLTLAGDVTNILADGDDPIALPRTLRFWIRARM